MAFLIPGGRIRSGYLVGLLLVRLVGPLSSSAATSPSRQYEIEAVLLFNLARFVDWPPESFSTTNAPLVLGVFGLDPFGPALDSVVQGENVNGHKIEVRRYSKIEEAGRCHILFISSAEKAKTARIIAALKGLPVLTVSDEEGFCRRYGGMVGFYVNEQNKVRLRLNLEAARFCGLHVSAKLIQVAELEKTGLLRSRPIIPVQSLNAGVFEPSIRAVSIPATDNCSDPVDSITCWLEALTITRRTEDLSWGV